MLNSMPPASMTLKRMIAGGEGAEGRVTTWSTLVGAATNRAARDMAMKETVIAGTMITVKKTGNLLQIIPAKNSYGDARQRRQKTYIRAYETLHMRRHRAVLNSMPPASMTLRICVRIRLTIVLDRLPLRLRPRLSLSLDLRLCLGLSLRLRICL